MLVFGAKCIKTIDGICPMIYSIITCPNSSKHWRLHKCAGKTTKNYCCIHPPLLDIELDHVVPDELHLLLRIMDVMIKNIIMDAVSWDEKDNWRGKK